MPHHSQCVSFTVLATLMVSKVTFATMFDQKLIIAHRGASGYVPEHTLEAVSMAWAMRPDYIEPDVVITSDAHPVILHDIHLDTVTDVALKFPTRRRADGRFYVIDFTLAEIKSLSVFERFDLDTKKPVFPNRFPEKKSHFQVATLKEYIELIQGLAKSTQNKHIGVYVEFKEPAFHRTNGHDISTITLKLLKRRRQFFSYGYTSRNSSIFIQCFDATELMRIKNDIFPSENIELKLIQLIRDVPQKTDAAWLYTLDNAAIKNVSLYADGIGPSRDLIIYPNSTSDRIFTSDLVALAHKHSLVVHPFTFRRDQLPAYAADLPALFRLFFCRMDVDGVFTDFADLARDFLLDAASCAGEPTTTTPSGASTTSARIGMTSWLVYGGGLLMLKLVT